jgi:soluble lytic murein transglycosylase
MNAPRRLVVIVIALAISNLSGGMFPLLQPASNASEASLSDSIRALKLNRDANAAARVLEALPTALQSDERSRLATAIAVECERTGLPLELVLGVIRVESSGNNFAVSGVGAIGLMQLMPATAKDVAERTGVHWRGAQTLFDPVVNVRLGVEYLRELIARYGNVETALAAYNWGPTLIAARIRRGEAIPASYVKKVLHASEATRTALL